MTQHVTPCQIRWVDMDAYKHVNNTAYLRYVEEARIRMFGLAGPAGALPAWEPTRIVIAAVDMDYRRPLLFRPEPVSVRSWVTRVGRSSFDLVQQVVDGDTLHASATATIVAVEGAFGGSRPLEAHEREWLAAHSTDLPAGHRAPKTAERRGPEPGPARHEVAIDVRWADLDANGHVNNVAFATYMQEARAHLFALHDTGGRAPLVRGLVVVRMHVDFVRPIAYGSGPVRACTWFSSVGAATVAVECELRGHDDDVLYGRGTTTLALFDFEADRPRRITPDERAALDPYVAEAQAVTRRC